MNVWYGIHFALAAFGFVAAFISIVTKTNVPNAVINIIAMAFGLFILYMAGAYTPIFEGTM